MARLSAGSDAVSGQGHEAKPTSAASGEFSLLSSLTLPNSNVGGSGAVTSAMVETARSGQDRGRSAGAPGSVQRPALLFSSCEPTGKRTGGGAGPHVLGTICRRKEQNTDEYAPETSRTLEHRSSALQ